ncbi:MAG: NAD(P)/FAD-dependent oxidoreductase [Clostridia bacterium]|jgi:hypothetical protein|nr:NAD(P)/FAD-dependent oxidoreductase [Clostridia bacterium]
MKIAIIGGGAAGLMAGGFLSKQGHAVTIFDGNEKCGKKLYITGKGRCNVTNACEKEVFLENVVNGRKFMMSAINQFSPSDTQNFFESLGVKLKVERGNRVFPLSDKASDIIKALTLHCGDCEIKLNEMIKAIEKKETFFIVLTSDSKYQFDRVIIATGGMSYSSTGSKGDGYKFAKMLGHNVVKPRGALVPIKLKDKFCCELAGLSLKNVKLTANYSGGKKNLFGEMLFTHDGISGPIALSLSSYISQEREVKLELDFKPALNSEQLENRLLREFSENLNKNLTYIIKGLLPRSLVEIFLNKAVINGETKVNSVSKEQRMKIISLLKAFPLNFDGLYPIEAGIITAGGVDLKEINPKTMESKLVKGLYFIGEVLDIDCLTGGFNLQTAFSTAYAAAASLI